MKILATLLISFFVLNVYCSKPPSDSAALLRKKCILAGIKAVYVPYLVPVYAPGKHLFVCLFICLFDYLFTCLFVCLHDKLKLVFSAVVFYFLFYYYYP